MVNWASLFMYIQIKTAKKNGDDEDKTTESAFNIAYVTLKQLTKRYDAIAPVIVIWV